MITPDHLYLARKLLEKDPLYEVVTDLPALRVFMAHHVWAVWDFMSLLKQLQSEVTCTTVPWVQPEAPPRAVRLVNEIVLAEESDVVVGYGVTSHLDLYRAAMIAVGADTMPINATQAALRAAVVPDKAIPGLAGTLGAPPGAQRFLGATMDVIRSGGLPALVGTFAFGREQLIPALFRPLLHHQPEAQLFGIYLLRHVELDGDAHGPAAEQLVEDLVHPDDRHEAYEAGLVALTARAQLWSAVRAAIIDQRAGGQ
jgi:hypothetical protein